MPIKATYHLGLDVDETLDVGVAGVREPVVRHNNLNPRGALDAGTTPPATKHVQLAAQALVAGAKTVDLTALVGTAGATVDGTGLKVRVLRIRNNGVSLMTFGPGAADPYQLWAGWSLPVPPGGAFALYMADGAGAVGAAAKNVDVAGTGTETFDLSVVFG